MAIKKINIGGINHELQTTVANITDLTATATELNYMDGVTSNVQTQLDGKSNVSHNHDSAYDAKGAANTALASAKTYADSVGTTVKNDLLNGAGAAYDTLKELGDLIDENADAIEALETVAAGKANASHSHVIADVADLTNATQSTNGLLSAADKAKLDYGGTPIVTTEGDGETYTATVDGMTSFVVGMKVTIIPNVASTTTSPKLNVNGLGAKKSIRMPITYNTSLTSTGVIDGWLLANKPVTVQWNGAYWITVDLVRTSAQYLYGAVPIANGGTGATTAAAALTNLGITSTAAELNKLDGVVTTTDELNYVAGVTSNIQEQLDALEADKQDQHKAVIVTLSASEWSNSTQTVYVSGVTSNNTVIVSSSPTNLSTYSEAGIYCSAQSNNYLTFNCETTPTVNVSANVMILV